MLTLRRTYPDNDGIWSVLAEGYKVGAIVYRNHVQDPAVRWTWSFQVHGQTSAPRAVNSGGSAASREEAMAAFRTGWDVLRPAMGDAGWAQHVDHMDRLAARDAQARRISPESYPP